MNGFLEFLRTYGKPVLIAALPVAILLILFEVHSAVIRRGQTIIGLRPDTPVILALQDICGRMDMRVRAWERYWDDSAYKKAKDGTTFEPCTKHVSVVIAKRPGAAISLYLNNEPVARQQSDKRVVRFDNVELSQAVNVLQVSPNDGWVWRPFGSTSPYASFIYYDRDDAPPRSVRDRPRSFFLGRAGVSSPVATTKVTELGVWSSPEGNSFGLVAGAPLSPLPELVYGTKTASSSLTNPAGLAVVRFEPKAARKHSAANAKLSFYRRLRIERLSDGRLQVDARTCLSKDHPYQARVLPADQKRAPGILPISGPAFVARFFDIQVGQWSRESFVAPPTYASVYFAEKASSHSDCQPVIAKFTLSSGSFVLNQSETAGFLQLPSDELELVNFGDDIRHSGAVASSSSHKTMHWLGSSSGDGVRLNLSYYNRTIAAMDRPSSDERLFTQYRELFDTLPTHVRSLLFLMSPVVPALLLLIVVRRRVSQNEVEPRIRQLALQGLSALVFFGIAYALLPYAHRFAYWLMNIAQIDWSVRDLANNVLTRNRESVPAAILVVVLTLVMLNRDPDERQDGGSTFWYATRFTFSLLVSALLIALGIAALRAQYLMTNPELTSQAVDFLSQQPLLEEIDINVLAGPLGPFWLTLVWSVIVTVLGTVAVAWALRSLSWPVKLRIAFGTSVVIFFLVMVPTIADTFAMSIAIMTDAFGARTQMAEMLGGASEMLASVAPTVILFLLSYLVLNRLIGFVQSSVSRMQNWSTKLLSALSALFVTLSLTGQTAVGQVTLNTDVILLTGLAQTYVPLLALILGYLVLSSMQPLERATVPPATVDLWQKRRDAFLLPDSAYVVCTAAFAGYVATWSLNPVSLVPVIVVGWFAFRYVILDPNEAMMVAPGPNLAHRYLTFLRETHLSSQIRDTARKAMAKGELDLRDYKLRINQANNRERDAIATMTDAERKSGKAILLDSGPEASPMRNALRGAAAGLVTALLLQALIPLNASIEDVGVGGSLLTLAKILLTETPYGIVRDSNTLPVVWLAIARILNALTLWITVGFLFGFVFHRIRGDDGFIKALRFSVGVGMAVLLAQAILGGSSATDIAAKLLPLTLFLLVTGTLVFDAASLRNRGLKPVNLVEIYGLKTSYGYASFAGALAAIQPLLTVFGWLGRNLGG